jgi:hypothetical protein
MPRRLQDLTKIPRAIGHSTMRGKSSVVEYPTAS